MLSVHCHTDQRSRKRTQTLCAVIILHRGPFAVTGTDNRLMYARLVKRIHENKRSSPRFLLLRCNYLVDQQTGLLRQFIQRKGQLSGEPIPVEIA